MHFVGTVSRSNKNLFEECRMKLTWSNIFVRAWLKMDTTSRHFEKNWASGLQFLDSGFAPKPCQELKQIDVNPGLMNL